MKRQFLPSLFALAAAAAFSWTTAVGGEQPGPGLEIIDGAAIIDSSSPIVEYPPEPIGALPYQPAMDYPAPGPVMVPTDEQSWVEDPFAPGMSEPPVQYSPDAYVAPADPSSEPPFDPYAETPVETTAPTPTPTTEVSVLLADPANGTLNSLNVQNRHFPGLAEAAMQRNLRYAADVVWDVLRKRRVVEATMLRGPGGSLGSVPQEQLQVVLDAINHNITLADSPIQAAARINTLLDAFGQTVVDDGNIGMAMEQCLLRLRVDIAIVREGMLNPTDDAMYLEVAKTYIRAATTCDFFVFDRQELITNTNAVMILANSMFYPDGASVGGDVAGITGNLFHILQMLDFYTRDDNRFRREIGPMWSTLNRPGRFIADVAKPNKLPPLFGPRGTRELTAPQVLMLDELFPRKSRITRIGLAASDSYPNTSTQKSYGGIYVTRSADDPNARYLAMRVGPAGALYGVPHHNDFGSLSLMSRNIEFITDPGGYGGEAAEAAVHSGLSLDGMYVVPESYPKGGEPVEAVWRTNASIDYLTAIAGFADGKSWQRTLVYVKSLPGDSKNDYWVVLDRVNMNNDPQPRQARIRYQLATGIQAYHDGSGILASGGFTDGSSLRFFAVDADSEMTVSEGSYGVYPGHVFTAAGQAIPAPVVTLARTLNGDSTTTTILYPGENMGNRPVRIERDSDIIRGRTGAVVIDHGLDRIDVVAWAPKDSELVTPTLNLQMSADLAVFRIRGEKIVRIDFINLERFQAKEPDGGLWSMRVHGAAQTLTLEPEKDGGWQVMADPANLSGATFEDVNFGPGISKRRFKIRPGEMRVIPR